jgi:hypothetical protein
MLSRPKLWLQQIPKTRTALETLSTKTQEIGHRARRCISRYIKRAIVEADMDLSRSFVVGGKLTLTLDGTSSAVAAL